MPSAAQQALIDAVRTTLADDPRVTSAWLSGSLGRGQGDAWSDVDVVAVVSEGDRAACLADYARDPGRIAETVLARELFGRLVTAVTRSWDRFDLMFVAPQEFALMDGAGLDLLLGDESDRPAPRPPPANANANARQVTELATEFLRVLGLAPVVFGRQEWLAGLEGVQILRKLAVDLMFEENGVGPAQRGGAKRINPFLTAEQRQALEAAPPSAADRDSLLAANQALARAVLPRAKALAARIGADWPEALEQATREHLQRELGLVI